MTDPSAKLPKHHYIPVFYLKQWRGADRRVIEFSRPYKDKVKPRKVDPDGTGYVRGLYRLPGVTDQFAEVIEQTFFKRVDDQAAIALQKLLRNEMQDWSIDLRKSWTLFLMSLFMRSPKIVSDALTAITDGLPQQWAEIQKQWAKDNPEEPLLEDFNSTLAQQYSLLALRRFIANDELGLLILSMIGGTMDLSQTPYRLVTSDRPVVMTDGLGYTTSHLALPLSPTMLFVATNTQEMMNELQAIGSHDLVRNCNRWTVRHAVKYVWAQDHSHDELIEREMSADAKDEPSPFTGPRAPQAGKELVPLAKDIGS
ncbi:DUF4238 domain-containing protein [Bradyrhizobium diazoefficiens]